MKIRQEILEYSNWFKINTLIEELNETPEEFIQRQEYVADIITAHVMLNEKINWEQYNQLSNESYFDFSIRVSKTHHYRIEGADLRLSSNINIETNEEFKDGLPLWFYGTSE